jgi:hypothetical protein
MLMAQKDKEGNNTVLCAANSYNQKFFINPDFSNLPEDVQKELKIISVDYTESIGGIFLMEFSPEGEMCLKSMHDDTDYLFDDEHANRRIQELSEKYQTLFSKLSMYYRAMKALRAGQKAGIDLNRLNEHKDIGEGNTDGHAEVRKATKEEQAAAEAENDVQAKPTGEWDMPVHPDDEHGEFSAYRTLDDNGFI